MKTGASRLFQRSLLVAAAGILALMLAACTGRGGGQLPPGPRFSAAASFGFSFSCQDSGGINPPTGQLKIDLSYNDKGSSLGMLRSSFGIHGIVDKIDPVVESAICIGKNPPPGGNELIFLGRYYLTSSPPAGFPGSCTAGKSSTTPLCRFEVVVRDNDQNLTPSPGDYFQITLSSSTEVTSEFSPDTPVFYTRGGKLSSGNLTVR